MARNAWLSGESQDAGGGDRQTRWLTPPDIVRPLGRFNLDPCGAPGHRLADHTYLLEDGADGLRDEWFGRVWLNPPYGREAEPFLRRMVEHGCGTALIFARTETASFHRNVWLGASGVLFLKGRISFLTPDGVRAKANAGASSCLVAYGDYDAGVLSQVPTPGHFVPLAPN